MHILASSSTGTAETVPLYIDGKPSNTLLFHLRAKFPIMSVLYQARLHRKNQRFAKKPLRHLETHLSDLEYLNFDNDEVPDDFVCFNVPISQAFTGLSEKTNQESVLPDLDSGSLSPVMSDDSFTFPNLQNNARAFNVLDSEVQNLTLEFNLNQSFLRREQMIQNTINKRKVREIQKKLIKSEKFWVAFLNDAFKDSGSKDALSTAFANLFSARLASFMNKYSLYSSVADRGRELARALLSRAPELEMDTHLYNPVFACLLPSLPEFDPNTSEKDPDPNCPGADVRYKKKYALPSNHADAFSDALYLLRNALGSLDLLSEASTTRSLIFSEARSLVLSVSSFGLLFRSASPSPTSLPNPQKSGPKLSKMVTFPDWWLSGLLVLPLPPLLLKFTLGANMTIRLVTWHLAAGSAKGMTLQTFEALCKEVQEFSRHFEHYKRLLEQLDNGARLELADTVVQLKRFLNGFEDRNKFLFQLGVFKAVAKELLALKFGPCIHDLSATKFQLKQTVLSFYFYLHDLGEPGLCFRREAVGLAHVLLTSGQNPYLAFSSLLSVFSRESKVPLLRCLVSDNSMVTDEQEDLNESAIKTLIKCLRTRLPGVYSFLRGTLKFDHHSKFTWLVGLILRRIFRPADLVIDTRHTEFVSRFLDVLFMDRNNNVIAYLMIVFLRTYEDYFLGELAEAVQENLEAVRRPTASNLELQIEMCVKMFVARLNTRNELLFKHASETEFIGEIRTEMIEDLNTGLTDEDVMEYIQLGFEQ